MQVLMGIIAFDDDKKIALSRPDKSVMGDMFSECSIMNEKQKYCKYCVKEIRCPVDALYI